MKTKVDLITGFLGSGKTTFLKLYLSYLVKKGERVCVLEFDYGAINVDMMLLQEFNNSVDLEMVAGGCDYDCHLRRFKTKLIAMGMRKYDRVIIEPSGIFDTDEFFDAIYEDPLSSWYELGTTLTILDVGLSYQNLTEESKYILMNQLSVSSLAILSKVQNYSLTEKEKTLTLVSNILSSYSVDFSKIKLIDKPYYALDEKDFESVMTSGVLIQEHLKKHFIEDNGYDSLYFMNTHLSLEKIKTKASILFVDDSKGHILRIKGFVFDKDWYEINLTKEETNITKISQGQDVIIVIGEKLDQEKINSLFS